MPALASSVGHAHHAGYDTTTQTTYIHTAELLSAAELDLEAPRLSTETISELCGANAATLRSIAFRLGHSRNAERVQHFEILARLRRTNVGLTEIRKLPRGFSESHRLPPREIDLPVLLDAIALLQDGIQIDDACATLRIEADALRRLVNAAARIPTLYSTNLFGLQGCEWSPSQHQLVWTNAEQLARGRAITHRLRSQLNDPATAQLAERVHAWVLYAKPPHELLANFCAALRSNQGYWATREPLVLASLSESLAALEIYFEIKKGPEEGRESHVINAIRWAPESGPVPADLLTAVFGVLLAHDWAKL